MIPADRNLSVSTVLDYGGEIHFPDGSFIYKMSEESVEYYVPHRSGENSKGEIYKRFPANKEGLYQSLKFLHNGS